MILIQRRIACNKIWENRSYVVWKMKVNMETFFKSVVRCIIPLSSLPIGRLDFVTKHKSFPSWRLIRQPKQVEVLGWQKIKIAVNNVVGWRSGYLKTCVQIWRCWMECWLDQWYVRNALFQDTRVRIRYY